MRKLCQKYEQIFSRTSPESELYKLNHGELEDKDGVSHISKELAELIQESLKYAELSQGAFDPTIGPVSSLWDFTSENPQIPGAKELQQKLPLVDYRQVQLNGQEIRFLQPEMQLDLGAIAKGYIADRLKDYLKEQGVTSATINLEATCFVSADIPMENPFLSVSKNPLLSATRYFCPWTWMIFP